MATEDGLTDITNIDGELTFFDNPSVILSDKVRYPRGFQTPGILNSSIYESSPDNVSISCPPETGSHGCHGPNPKQFSAFLQDDWRPTSRLTLNLGIRYDLSRQFLAEAYLPDNPTYQALAAIGSPYGRLPKTPTTDFSPRVGFAYQLNKDGKSVLRGGFGLYYDENDIAAFFRVIGQSNPPFAVTQVLTNTAIGVGQLANFVFGTSQLPVPADRSILPPGGGTLGQWLNPDYQNPFMRQYHIGFERQLAEGLAFNADYVHSDGRHEFRVQDINYLVRGTRILAPTLGQVVGDSNLIGQLRLYSANGESRFDEMTLKLQGRLPRMTWQLTYELAGAYSYGGRVEDTGVFPVDQAAGIGGPANGDRRTTTSGIASWRSGRSGSRTTSRSRRSSSSRRPVRTHSRPAAI